MHVPAFASLVGLICRTVVILVCLLPLPALAQLAPVELAAVEHRDVIETLRLTGSLTSPKRASLSPDVEGRVVELTVDAGARVKSGAVLFRLDDELARLQLAQAVAYEHEAEANLKNARRRAVEARSLVSKKTFPESEARNLEAEVDVMQAVLEGRRSERAYAAATLKRHVYRAPFTGVIAERNADLGERVDTDSSVMLLISTDNLRLDLRVPQQYFGRIGRDTPLRVAVDALPGQVIETGIVLIVPVSDPEARTFVARAAIENFEARLAPGMSVSAELRIGTERSAEVVPRDALIRYPDGRTTVWVAEVDGDVYRVEERLVQTGLGFDGVVEILEGLTQGEQVVTHGNEALQPGQQVRIRE